MRTPTPKSVQVAEPACLLPEVNPVVSFNTTSVSEEVIAPSNVVVTPDLIEL